MSDMSKATPRPWRYQRLDADGVVIKRGGRFEIVTDDYDVAAAMESSAPIRNEADAALIVAAVNEYVPGLKDKARELALMVIRRCGEFDDNADREQVVETAREVLRMMGGDDGS